MTEVNTLDDRTTEDLKSLRDNYRKTIAEDGHQLTNSTLALIVRAVAKIEKELHRRGEE